MGDFALAVMQAFTPNAGVVDPRLAPLAAASGMQQQVPSEGGFLVPPQFSQAIWDEFNQQPDNLLAMTDNYTVTGESLTFNANAETSRATGSRYGGIKGYWINEADQATKSKPKFRQVRIEPQQMVVLVYITEKLLRNAGIALGQYVTRAAARRDQFPRTGDAIFRGTAPASRSGSPTATRSSP
jgi:HK97 family phage major capsid protein